MGRKNSGRFKRLINNISHKKTWTCLRIGNLKRETESLLIAAQNNAVRTNHIKARIDKTQQNSKCRLCGDRDERINHIISECSKLAQKESKTRHGWVGRGSTGGCARNLNLTIRTNGICTISYGTFIQTDHLISTRRPDIIIINYNDKKRTCKIVDFAVPTDHRIKLKECEKKDKYFDLTRQLKKLWNMKVTIIPIVIGAFDTVTKEGLGSWWTNGDDPNYSIENGQNTKKSHGDLKRLAVSQTPVKDHQR